MTRVFDAEVFVEYSQAYLQVRGLLDYSMERAFAGQVNGLCGAQVPGLLFLTTGLHTGWVPFGVDVLEREPTPMDDAWEDVVEVSYATPEPEVFLLGWGGGSSAVIDLASAGSFRVRYSARGMDAGRDADSRDAGEAVADQYLLQFWPAPPAGDAVLSQGSTIAGYWHDVARTLPPPPPAPTPKQVAAAERAAAERERSAREQAEARCELHRWNGRAPSPRLRALGGNVLGVAREHRDLLDAFAEIEADTQRAAARWLAHRAFELAELTKQDWVRPALLAMDRGDPLPTPFTSMTEAQLQGRPAPSQTSSYAVVVRHGEHEAPRRIHRPSFAVPALFAAVQPDPLQALVDTFSHAAATYDDQQDTMIAELRARYLRPEQH